MDCIECYLIKEMLTVTKHRHTGLPSGGVARNCTVQEKHREYLLFTQSTQGVVMPHLISLSQSFLIKDKSSQMTDLDFISGNKLLHFYKMG